MGDLSREGIALLEHVAETRARPEAAEPRASAIARGLDVVRASTYRLFTGPVRHSELSAEDAAALLKVSTQRAGEALDELVKAGALVLEGSMYKLPRAVARELGPDKAKLSEYAKQLGARAGQKAGPARAAALANRGAAQPVPAASTPRTRELKTTCKYSECGRTFTYPSRRGPAPVGCLPEHRRLYLQERDKARNGRALESSMERARIVPATEQAPAEVVPTPQHVRERVAIDRRLGSPGALAPSAPDPDKPSYTATRSQVLSAVSKLAPDEGALLLSDLLHLLCARARDRSKP